MHPSRLKIIPRNWLSIELKLAVKHSSTDSIPSGCNNVCISFGDTNELSIVNWRPPTNSLDCIYKGTLSSLPGKPTTSSKLKIAKVLFYSHISI